MRRVGLPVEFADVRGRYGFSGTVPELFTGRGRWVDGPMHTFVDDWRQEFFWRRPSEGAIVAVAAGVVTAPDYTAWTDDPYEWRVWQAWRSATVARYWSGLGVSVLPVVAFGVDQSRWVEPGSTWAVRAPSSDAGRWLSELEAWAACVSPARLIVFGRELPGGLRLPCPVSYRRLRVRREPELRA